MLRLMWCFSCAFIFVVFCSACGGSGSDGGGNSVDTDDAVHDTDIEMTDDDVANTGDSGDTADTADTGNTGNTGDTGDTADTADTGDTSDTGDSADTADTGDTGDTGDSGDTADTGDTGLTSCDFGYEQEFAHAVFPFTFSPDITTATPENRKVGGMIDHGEPPPPYTYRSSLKRDTSDLVMPGYDDSMLMFDRANDWLGQERCFELPGRAEMLSQSDAYDLYRSVVRETTGVDIITDAGVRTVIGLRGAYPGTFTWNGNYPDLFNDTLVLLWRDGTGKHILEFPVNTDTGRYNYSSMSSLLPNRMYSYVNGWHNGDYNALHINEPVSYRTADDANSNGHWDCERNGWLDYNASEIDYIRVGGGHNIHMASVEPPLGTAKVGAWSAGCQTIPGRENWDRFIFKAWTNMGDEVDYFLLDARDISSAAFDNAVCTPDGSHACPFIIDAFPFEHSADTGLSAADSFGEYGCSAGTDESGPEYLYEITVDSYGTLSVSVACDDPVDIDIHLLSMDDPNACLIRDNMSFTWDIAPGRYLIAADTYVDGSPLAGAYTLSVDFTAD